MSQLSEKWLQSIAKDSLKLPPLNPIVCNMLLSIIEIHIKRIIQQASKFQKHSKSRKLTVEDINSALIMNKIEPLYGLSAPAHLINMNDNQSISSSKLLTKQFSKLINLVEFGKGTTLPPCPLKPEVSLHWLVVHGQQPLTADNPSIISNESEEQPLDLPRELQHLYARITGVILASESSPGLVAAMKVLRTDPGIQDLTPYFSRFFYQQIRSNTKRLPLLTTIIKAIKSLFANPHTNLEFHLQQLLPAVFTCIVASKLCILPSDDHWALRGSAAEVIALINGKFSSQFPDLHARICKTYIDALDRDKSLSTLYGGLVGLSSMGINVIRLLLLPNLIHLEQILLTKSSKPISKTAAITATVSKTNINDSSCDNKDDLQNPHHHEEELILVATGIPAISSSTSTATTNNNNTTTNNTNSNSAPVGSKHILVTDSHTTNSSANTSNTVKKRKELASDNIKSNCYNKDLLYQQYQINTEVNMCRHALLELLGKYVIHITKLFEYEIISNRNTLHLTVPKLKKIRNIKTSSTSKTSSNRLDNIKTISDEKYSDNNNNRSLPLCDLEEMLVPYYAAASKQDYYCRLLI